MKNKRKHIRPVQPTPEPQQQEQQPQYNQQVKAPSPMIQAKANEIFRFVNAKLENHALWEELVMKEINTLRYQLAEHQKMVESATIHIQQLQKTNRIQQKKLLQYEVKFGALQEVEPGENTPPAEEAPQDQDNG